MPPDQGDLFGSIPARRPRPVAAVEAVPVEDPAVLMVMGVALETDQVEREINRLYRSVTGPLAHKRTICVTARELATAALAVERLKGRALAVLRAWQAQEIAIGQAKADAEKK